MTEELQIHPPTRRITYLGHDLAGFEPAVNKAYYSLDPNVRYLWVIGRGIRWTFLLGFLMVFAFVGGLASSSWSVWAMRALLVMIPWACVSLVWPFFAYSRWGLAIRMHDITIRYGVLYKRLVAVPFARIQHVDTHSGPIERSMGLATLIVHTAGSQLGSITVPGLPKAEAEQLRDYLSKMGHTHANL